MKKNLFERLTIAQTISFSFFLLVIIGGTVLSLPISSRTGQATNFLDGLFTATSALCVTGQTTLNTATHWSPFGKATILTLIEIGGLGIMGVLSLFFFALGKQLNLHQQRIVQESLNLNDLNETRSIIKYVVKFSLAVQALGILFLAFDFVPRFGWGKGLIYSIFHSISAFCNAGFDLFGNSLISFQKSPYVLVVIGLLIAFGGLGFIVWRDLFTFYKNKKLLFHSKIVLFMTGAILGISFILFFISESMHGTFTHLNFGEKIANTFFLTVTPRTAGFSNIDYNEMSTAGLFLTNILMFIGGASGSTAGGFKVTTLLVVILFYKSMITGREPQIFNRSINPFRVRKAIFLFTTALMLIVSAIFLLLLTQDFFPPGYGLEAVLMEVFSCFGTVGLSMGLTPYFNSFGKFILMVLMFMGRVGALTVIWSLKREERESKIHYPEGSVMIG
ncbi:TrkH family potassium uptake protein [Allofustis seminis]|uniref:TrkH family potassium uptake protein n=1 Tax=Allofustis seminis TaxID=166939 RepID=UPI00036B5122|nr:Trk family potassium uptake protein [Allofustis seminis]